MVIVLTVCICTPPRLRAKAAGSSEPCYDYQADAEGLLSSPGNW